MEVLILVHRKSTFSLITSGGTSEILQAFLVFRSKIFFSMSCVQGMSSVKGNFFLPLYLVWMLRVLAWSLYFAMIFKAESSTFWIIGSTFEHRGSLRFFNMFEKNLFKTSAVFIPFLISLLSSVKSPLIDRKMKITLPSETVYYLKFSCHQDLQNTWF